MAFDQELINQYYPEAKMIEPMKIWKLPQGKENLFSQICGSGEYFGEIKVDGYFYEYEKTDNYAYLFSRNTSTTTGLLSEKSANVPHIMDALSCMPANTILIGEIYYPGGTSKTVTSVMGCLPELAIKRQENNPIHYYLHDIIYYDGVQLVETAAEKRYKILQKIWELHNLAQYPFLRLAEAFDTDIPAHLKQILDSGGEGVVLRKKDLPYYPGKRPAWSTIKMKKMDTADLVCVGFEDATMEYTGKLDLSANYGGTEADQWPYWCIFEEIFLSTANSFTPKEMVPIGTQKVLRSPNFVTLPVTKGFYYGWKTRMRVGAYDDNGNLVEVGSVSSGLTDEDRKRMATHPEEYLGHVFCFEMMEKDNKEHTLRHGHLVSRRPDKDAKDCIISEIFI